MVLMMVWRSSPIAWRISLTHWASDSSVTITLGHTRLDDFVFGHQPAAALDEVAQDIEAFGTQFDLAIGTTEAAARDIQRIAFEVEHLAPPSMPPSPQRVDEGNGL